MGRSVALIPAPAFAYSLCQVENGWRWSVYDEDGVTVAGGDDPSRAQAEAAVERTLRKAPTLESGDHAL